MSIRDLIPRRVKQTIRRLQHQAQARAVLKAQKQAATPALAPIDCALVIPVHDDAERLSRLITQARELNCFAQIVVIDDGSTPPIASQPDITLIRHQTAQGAGAARNAGLRAVTTSHLLYFDSDDLLTRELPLLLGDLGTQEPFDFCLFKHADSRTVTEGHWGQPPWDEAHWIDAGLSIGTLQTARPDTWPMLAKTANYPWNKIYRTAFLRDNNVQCATTPVHEDITLHWLGFLAAETVLVSDRICAWHLVSAGSGHQSNRNGAERLTVFEALQPVVQAAQVKGDTALQSSLVSFTVELMDWIKDHLDPALHADLDAAERAWLNGPVKPWHDHLDPEARAAIASRLVK